MSKQVAIMGLGRFGISLARVLFNLGHDVLALDKDDRKVQSIAAEITHAVQADATDEAVLKELGIGNFDVAVVSMATAVESSVLCTILLKKLGVPYVIARAENELHKTILERIGADKVVYVEQEMGIRIAHGLTLRDVQDYMSVAPDYGIAKLVAPLHFAERTLIDLQLGPRGKSGVAVLLIQRGKEVIVTPDRAEVVKPDDVLILAGSDDRLEQLLSEVKQA